VQRDHKVVNFSLMTMRSKMVMNLNPPERLCAPENPFFSQLLTWRH